MDKINADKKVKKEYWVLPIAILFMGTLLRAVLLGQIPQGLHWDEAYAAWNTFSLYCDGIDSSGHVFPVYFEAWGHGQNALYEYLLLPLYVITGGNLNEFVIRLPQFIVAEFTILVSYPLLKRMFGRNLALIGMFLLTISPWHITMSRWGLESNLAPGFLIFGLYFFIKGLDNYRYFLLSALFYGLSLYAYAVIWPIVPVMVLLEVIYGIVQHKIRFNWINIFSLLLLFVLALPLLLFLLINMGYLNEINLPFLSMYQMSQFRGSEIAGSFTQIYENIRNTGSLLWHQDVGQPYDVVMPYGFFYTIGRVFAVAGVILLCVNMIKKFIKKAFSYEVFLFIQLIGAAIVGCLVTVSMHKINCFFIPIVFCQAYGILTICKWISSHKKWIGKTVLAIIISVYLISLIGFQYSYYTGYKETCAAYYQAGTKEAVQYAMEQGEDVVVNAGLKYPSVLLFTETTGREYLDTVVYTEEKPAPASFTKNGVTFFFGIDYDNIEQDKCYIIYSYTDRDYFATDKFDIREFEDWCVAVPKK